MRAIETKEKPVKNLTREMVAESNTGTPEHLSMYAYDVTGPAAIAIAAKMCVLHGRTVRVAACVKDGGEPPVIKEIFEWATVPGYKVVRYCFEGNPNGAESHTLHGSVDEKGDPTEMDVVEVAAKMTWVLACSGNCAFRLK